MTDLECEKLYNSLIENKNDENYKSEYVYFMTGTEDKIKQNLERVIPKVHCFLSELKKDNTTFKIIDSEFPCHFGVVPFMNEDSVKHIGVNCLSIGSDTDSTFELPLIHKCRSLERRIENHVKDYVNIRDNYEKIKKNIGKKQLKEDNNYFIKEILETEKILSDLLRRYWVTQAF